MFESKRKKLSDRMKNEAVSLGLCAEWTAEWRDGSTKDEMAEKYVRGIDFCIAHNWPSCDVIKREFGDVMHSHGVYVDESVRLRNPGTVILNGHCDATITCDGYSVTNVYVRHKSKLSIVCRGFANVRVNVLDDACVTVDSEPPAKAFVYHYSGDVKASGNAVVRDRHDFKFS